MDSVIEHQTRGRTNMTYQEALSKLNLEIKNIAVYFDKHCDEVFVDLAEME